METIGAGGSGYGPSEGMRATVGIFSDAASLEKFMETNVRFPHEAVALLPVLLLLPYNPLLSPGAGLSLMLRGDATTT